MDEAHRKMWDDLEQQLYDKEITEKVLLHINLILPISPIENYYNLFFLGIQTISAENILESWICF